MSERTLVDIANDYVTQNNHGTRHPIMLIVTETMDIPNIHSEGKYMQLYRDGDYWDIDNEKDLWDIIIDYVFDGTEYKYLNQKDKTKYQNIKWELDNMGMDYVIREYLDDFGVYSFDKERIYKGKQAFLTITGAEQHIRMNGHNMANPKWFVVYANRNPEMHTVINQLYELATVPKEEWNYEARNYYDNYLHKEDK